MRVPQVGPVDGTAATEVGSKLTKMGGTSSRPCGQAAIRTVIYPSTFIFMCLSPAAPPTTLRMRPSMMILALLRQNAESSQTIAVAKD